MRRIIKASTGVPVAIVLLPLAALHLACQDGATVAKRNGGPTTTPSDTASAGPTQVRVTIVMVVEKKYGLLAHVTGKRDVTITDAAYDPAKNWRDNPMVVFEDAGFPPRVSTHADAESISGSGKSSNASVEVILVPHVDLALNRLAAADCVKGTIEVTITALSDYYDGKWIDVSITKDKPLLFQFDTSVNSRPLEPIASETRTVSQFSFERYLRDQQKWEPRSAWPAKPKDGDWRCTIYARDAKLTLTGYRYLDGPRASAR